MILIDAIYINNSGGKILLDYLIEELEKKQLKVHYLLDERIITNHPVIKTNQITFLKASLLKRHKFYLKYKNSFSKVFCFGNVPPPIKLNNDVYVYFHNVLLAESLKGYPLKNKLFKYLKRCYIKFFMKNVDEVFVQTAYVSKLFKENINNKVSVSLFPFYNLFEKKNRTINNAPQFVYLSNGNSHKNHDFLLDVWKKLGELNYYPILNLTVTNDYFHLIERIENLKQQGININNFGFTDVSDLFARSTYLIYPSLKESFGLGLVEGVHAGLKVIGADLEYTYEVVKPSLTFNPFDSANLVNLIIEIIENKIELVDSKIIIQNKINQLIEKLLKNKL